MGENVFSKHFEFFEFLKIWKNDNGLRWSRII